MVLLGFLKSHSGNKMWRKDSSKADPRSENVFAWGPKHREVSAYFESVKVLLGPQVGLRLKGTITTPTMVTHQGDFPLWFQQLRFMECGSYGSCGSMSRV